MGKLSILGAQRVKALQEFLKDQEREAIRAKEREQASYNRLRDIVDEEFQIRKQREQLDKLYEQADSIATEIESVTGERINLSRRTSYHQVTPHKVRLQELQQEQRNEINDIKKEYNDKRNRLWLCETLEEAKEIVGIE